MDALAYLRLLSNLAEENAEDMLLIGQAQGRIMDADRVTATEALVELFAHAVRDETDLAAAARRILRAVPHEEAD